MVDDIRTTHGRHGERGAALAELTIVVPLMFVLLLVVFDLGRGFMEYVSVTDGARDGARVAAQYDMDCTVADDRAEIRAITRAAAEPLEALDVVVTPGADGVCSVTVTHTYDMLIPFVDSQVTLPGLGTIGPLWDGVMSETAVSA